MRIDKKKIEFVFNPSIKLDVLSLTLTLSDHGRTPEIKQYAIETIVDPLHGAMDGELLGLAGSLEYLANHLRNCVRGKKLETLK